MIRLLRKGKREFVGMMRSPWLIVKYLYYISAWVFLGMIAGVLN